jgi:hypothetical protein
MLDFIINTFGPIAEAVWKFVSTTFRRFAEQVVNWLLDQVRGLCESLAAWIAARQEKARHAGLDDGQMRSQVVAKLGEVMGDVAARIVERAETMTPEEALVEFQLAFDEGTLVA